MVVKGYDLHCDFDAQKHLENYPHYLEVILDENGTVFYAVPSHKNKLSMMAANKLGISEDDLWDKCQPEYYADAITWLCMETGFVAVWTNFYIGNLNYNQKQTLNDLKFAGIYEGEI